MSNTRNLIQKLQEGFSENEMKRPELDYICRGSNPYSSTINPVISVSFFPFFFRGNSAHLQLRLLRLNPCPTLISGQPPRFTPPTFPLRPSSEASKQRRIFRSFSSENQWTG
ncbi:hypothetical protein SLE2022_079090 [Rubroshorea leprosula]